MRVRAIHAVRRARLVHRSHEPRRNDRARRGILSTPMTVAPLERVRAGPQCVNRLGDRGCGQCPQELVLASSADIVIAGGSAGGGKTRALMLEPIRHLKRPHFGAVLFRREMPRITQLGGMWDESYELYGPLGGTPRVAP